MSMEKILKTGAAATIVLTATAGSLSKDITIANADNINKTGVVNTSALNVRKGPSTKNGIVTKVYKGDKVTITDSSNGWYKVKLSNGKVGWVSDDYIKVTSSSSSSNSTSSSKTGTVTTNSLNVRSGAGTKYSKVASVSKGTKVTITETKNNWHKIKMSNGKTGWVSADYIKISTSNSSSSSSNSSSSSVSNKIGTVNTSSLNVRKGAGTNYSVIATVKSGQKVGVLSSKNGWYNVLLSNGKKGWVSSKYVKVSNGDPNSVLQDNTNTNKVEKIVALAKKQLGKPYEWGAEGPNSFDCSGLTYYVYKQHGITLPRSSKAQSQKGKTISKSNLQAGDLVFFNTNGSGVSHVGIYIGNGNMIHSTKPGDVVKTTSINSSYYKNKFVTAKRYL